MERTPRSTSFSAEKNKLLAFAYLQFIDIKDSETPRPG